MGSTGPCKSYRYLTSLLKPLSNYVLIDPIHEKSDILTNDVDMEPTNRGKVVAIGGDVRLVKKGDEVLFKPHLFDALDVGKGVHLIGREDGLVAIC